MNEFFGVSQCTTVKQIWDTLEETHEETTKVKRSRLNTLSQDYKMFGIQLRESIVALEKGFVHLKNHLIALGKTFINDDLNLKVLRSLTREWKPKVTKILEKKILSTMMFVSLFGKLQKYELEVGRIEKHENKEKKTKGIALKVDSKEEQKDNSPEEDENCMFLVKRLGKLLGHNEKSLNHAKRKKFFRKKEASTSTQDVTCYECGKQGHIKTYCPKLTKKSGFKSRKETKSKRAYIAWEYNEISSSSNSENDENENLALMASHHSNEEDE